MNKTMILAILIAYKAFNDRSLTIVVNEGEGKYVANNAVVDSIDDDNISISSCTHSVVYGKTINTNDIVGIQFQVNTSADNIDYDDDIDDNIDDNIDDYEYPYNHVNRVDL